MRVQKCAARSLARHLKVKEVARQYSLSRAFPGKDKTSLVGQFDVQPGRVETRARRQAQVKIGRAIQAGERHKLAAAPDIERIILGYRRRHVAPSDAK